MPQPRQMKAFISSVEIHMVHHVTRLLLPNTRMEFGKTLETWLKLDINIVLSPLGCQQWLLVDIQIVDHRKFIQKLLTIILFYFQEQILSYGNWILSKVKSSIAPCQPVTIVWACFQLILDIAARIEKQAKMNRSWIRVLYHMITVF